ncbi:hypothetical protein VCHA37P192_280037 [Vibrio chagasii]|nr:hypothetical protein VCHA37P192_280037 [Vibrio chagasii]
MKGLVNQMVGFVRASHVKAPNQMKQNHYTFFFSISNLFLIMIK